MNSSIYMTVPDNKEKITLRLMIVLGLLSIIYFYYWFFDTSMIHNKFLYWILVFSLTYDIIKTLYLWYHYWDISIPEKPQPTRHFSVDVLTTYFPGEPYEMVKETLLAIKKIKYPHTTYLCDEANDGHLREFCKNNDIVHVTRNNRKDAKAGNINNALKQAKGELCLILDPDHVPFDNFLDEVVPYFEDETIGFVQSVQAYYNITESSVAKGGAEQTFHFYGPVMMTMNSYGTVNAIGANCIFRRKALDSIGGHAPGLSEDMHTAMQLHARGWKSVYVPNAFTKGLTPGSLTAFFKQQLKWSRGTFELLVSVYPRLFSKFSFRQKLHYGILPFHFFSGIIYLINFLIPVISLFSASTPWKGNVLDFALMLAPVVICAMGIRFYVQKWLMYSSERGLHMTGGLLQINTWWINIIGFFYTLIRKKVPYLPTPKEDKEKTSWIILLPNLLIALLSLAAIAYGLSVDFTPFSIFMSFFALLNAGFMLSSLWFAFGKQTPVSFKDSASEIVSPLLNRLQNIGFEIRRRTALPSVIVVLILTLFIHNNINYKKWIGVKPPVTAANTLSYLGIFAPESDNGLSDMRKVREIADRINENFEIVALYIPWDKYTSDHFPWKLIDSIYHNTSIPLITWEPWIDSFGYTGKVGKDVFDLINEGRFDAYIEDFAVKLKNFQKPVFLRFAHEFDNPVYPWYIEGSDNIEKFRRAWIRTHEIFDSAGAVNVVWIWNPWKSETVASWFPGTDYADWIGIDILNYGKLNPDGKSYSFEGLYEPFHAVLSDLPSVPVMISEFGSLKESQSQEDWLSNAFNVMEKDYPEIKSVVYFDSKVDNNLPLTGESQQILDWSLPPQHIPGESFVSKDMPDYIFDTIQNISIKDTILTGSMQYGLKNLRGVNLKKGHNWRKDYHVLSRETLLSDFKNMKSLTLNTIKFESSSVYKYNVLDISREMGLNVLYGFWISEYTDFVTDTSLTHELKSGILEEIQKRKHDSNIIAWNIQNDVLFNERTGFHKPELLFQNRAYLRWLKDLVGKVKTIDHSRPVVVDLEVNGQSVSNLNMLIDNVPGIDYIGLVVKDSTCLGALTQYLRKSNIPYIFSEVTATALISSQLLESKESFFITAWQDQHESDKLTFEGLLDRNGRFREDFFNLKNKLSGSGPQIISHDARILKPSIFIYDNMKVEYTAMVYDKGKGWQYGWNTEGLKFEWSLVRCDRYGNYLALHEMGEGPVINLRIPEEQNLYRLMLTVYDGTTVNTTITRLNTPLKGRLAKKTI